MKYHENDTLDVLIRRLSSLTAEEKGICFLPVGSVKREEATALCRAAQEIRKRTVKSLTILVLTTDLVAMGRIALAIRACNFEGAVLCEQDGMRFLVSVHGEALFAERLFPADFAFPEEKEWTPTHEMAFYLGIVLYAAGEEKALLPAMDRARRMAKELLKDKMVRFYGILSENQE